MATDLPGVKQQSLYWPLQMVWDKKCTKDIMDMGSITALSDTETIIQQVGEVTIPNKYLYCSICLEPFNQPKVLPCLHSFCKTCLEKLGRDKGEAETRKSESSKTVPSVFASSEIVLRSLPHAGSPVEIRCPLCKSVHITQIELLPTDYLLQQEVQALANDKKAETASCGLCAEIDHVLFGYCPQCASFICQVCNDAHKRMKTFRSHSVIAILDYKPQPQMLSRNIYCADHEENEFDRFCGTCGVSICHGCALEKHYKHDILTIKDAKQQVKESMQQLHSEVTCRLQQWKGHLEVIKKTEYNMTQHEEYLKAEVNATCDIAVQRIETARLSLLSVIDDTYKEQSKKVWAEKDMVERTILGQESCLERTDRLLKSDNDTAMVYLSSQSLRRLKELSRVCNWNAESIDWKLLIFKEPIPISVGDIIQSEGQLNCLIIKFSNDGFVLRGRQYSFSVIAQDYKSMFTSPAVTVSARIQDSYIFSSTCSMGSYDANKSGWDGTFLCKKEGTCTLKVTATIFGKAFDTAFTDFYVSSKKGRKGFTDLEVFA